MPLYLTVKDYHGDPEEIMEFNRGNEILELQKISKSYLEYLFHKEHSQVIRRFIDGGIVEETVTYTKTTRLILHKDLSVLVINSGGTYSDFLCRRIGSAINFPVKPKKVDFINLFASFDNKSISYEPLKIKIKNFITEPFMIADIDASVSMKDKFLNLIQSHSENIISVKISFDSVGNVEVTNEFSLVVYNQNIDIINLLDILLCPLEVEG